MNIYNKLNNDIKEIIDIKYYNDNVKPLQNLVICELTTSFIPKCLICKKPLVYINWYGNNEYYYRTHELCIQCYNDSEPYMDDNGLESDNTILDYESDDTVMTFDSNASAYTI